MSETTQTHGLGFRIGSLFSGIGGLELGLEWAGVGHTVWQVEQNAYCRAVLATHWPDAQRFEDVREVGAHKLPPVDVLCGGFPCQDVSNAGRRAGVVEGTRSGLWYEYARLIRELRPRYVVVENVAALLTLGLDAVLGELAASGYDAEWSCVQAADVGAPHLRDRVFVVAYPNGDALWAPAKPERGGRSAAIAPLDGAAGDVADAARQLPHGGRNARHGGTESPDGRSYVAHTHGQRELQREGGEPHERGRAGDRGAQGVAPNALRQGLQGHGDGARGAGPQHAAARDARWWATEPDVGRMAHGVPARVDRLRALGNAVVPQVAEVVGRVIVERERALEEARHVAA